MIYKPSNPFSVVLFLISLVAEGAFRAVDWGVSRFQRRIARFRSGKPILQSNTILAK